MENSSINSKTKITQVGLRNAAIALICGFVAKAICDYFCAKNLIINLSKSADLISNENIVDSISFANQVGRLDLVSLCIALLGLVLGFGAIYGFMHIKEDAHRTAEHEAKEFLKKNGRQLIKEVLASEANNAEAMTLSAKKIAREEKKAGTEYEELGNESFENE